MYAMLESGPHVHTVSKKWEEDFSILKASIPFACFGLRRIRKETLPPSTKSIKCTMTSAQTSVNAAVEMNRGNHTENVAGWEKAA